jgi:hypothetical protein
MKDWKDRASAAVLQAANSGDPEAVPEYYVPKPKPWWAFWRRTEWELIQGVSLAQMRRAHQAQARRSGKE